MIVTSFCFPGTSREFIGMSIASLAACGVPSHIAFSIINCLLAAGRHKRIDCLDDPSSRTTRVHFGPQMLTARAVGMTRARGFTFGGPPHAHCVAAPIDLAVTQVTVDG